MSAQNNMDAVFLAKAAEGRKVHLERLMEVLDEYLKEVFADYKELLLEDTKEWIGKLQAETEQRISGAETYEELKSLAFSREITEFVDGKITGLFGELRGKEKVCSDMIAKLLLGSDADLAYAAEKAEPLDFLMDVQSVLDLKEEQELSEIQRERMALSAGIEQTEKEKEETETAFRELVRQNAEVRSRMEAERPEVKYLTKRIRREGFFGFLVDLLGKAKTETIVDDSELVEWQKRVDEVQKEYDEKARNSNDRIEALKVSWREKEEQYDRLDTLQKQMVKRFKEQLRMAYLEGLEEHLHGEGGLSDHAAAVLERDLNRNAEKIRGVIWEEYRKRQ